MRLAGKRAVVTGGASGFGLAIAEHFASEGARVALLDINAEGAREQAEAISRKVNSGAAIGLACDVTSRQQTADSIAKVAETFGGLDIVVNNAGWTHKNKPLMEVTEEEFDRIYDVNVKAIFHMTQIVVPLFREQGTGGVIINIGSTAGIRPRPGLTFYNGSKGAANILSKSMAAELAPDKIRVCGIAPVIGETALLEAFMGMPDTPENRRKFEATIPLGRMSRPADIANAAVYLASDEAEFITGVVLEVDGGRCV
jgi:3-oxoacyl-[acyl-carrier protein] reductase